MDRYGQELILDLHDCDVREFNRESIEQYLVELCERIGMEREDLHWWDYKGVPEEDLPTEVHLLGTSCVQFITTSNIILHTKDLLASLNVNIFSCKSFSSAVAKEFTEKWFGGKVVNGMGDGIFIERF